MGMMAKGGNEQEYSTPPGRKVIASLSSLITGRVKTLRGVRGGQGRSEAKPQPPRLRVFGATRRRRLLQWLQAAILRPRSAIARRAAAAARRDAKKAMRRKKPQGSVGLANAIPPPGTPSIETLYADIARCKDPKLEIPPTP